jgi:hypothetical protein
MIISKFKNSIKYYTKETFSVTDEALFKARGTELSEWYSFNKVDPTKFNTSTPAVLGQIKTVIICHKVMEQLLDVIIY